MGVVNVFTQKNRHWLNTLLGLKNCSIRFEDTGLKKACKVQQYNARLYCKTIEIQKYYKTFNLIGQGINLCKTWMRVTNQTQKVPTVTFQFQTNGYHKLR